MAIKAGDTVKVLAHRNALHQDISTWRKFPFNIGQQFVVGRVDDDNTYPCSIVFPVGEDSEFWREDDLEIVSRSDEAGDFNSRVRACREAHGVGLLEARRMVEQEDLLADIAAANSFTAVRAILRQMVGAK